MAGLTLPSVDERNFREVVLLAERPVVVFFHDPEINNSSKMQHVIQTLLWLYEDRLLFFQVDIQDNPVLAEFYQVKQPPVCLLLVNGHDNGRITGYITGRHLMITLDDFLARVAEYGDCLTLADPVNADDVLDMYQFLLKFEGDFLALFQAEDAARSDAKRSAA